MAQLATSPAKHGLPRLLALEPNEAHLVLSHLSTTYSLGRKGKDERWEDTYSMPARTGHACVHSAKYKEDSSPSDNSDIGQSVASVSTLLTDKTTPGHRYVTPVWLSTTQVPSSLMDECTITPTMMWGPQRGVRSPTLTGSYAPDPTSGGRGNRIPTPGAGSPRWDNHSPRTVTS